MKAFFNSLARWVFGRRRTFEEYYLSQSTDLADLERRQKRLQSESMRHGIQPQIKYWL